MRWLCCLPLGLLLIGCGRKPPDATPEGVVREFLERMERVNGDPKDARAAFELLAKPSQANLTERSKRASAAFGKRMSPEQMLAPSHYFPRFQPRQWATRPLGKQRAVVEVLGLDPASERAEVPCVKEETHWRIDLALPALPPVERRPGAEPR